MQEKVQLSVATSIRDNQSEDAFLMDGLGKALQLDGLFVGSFHILLFVSFANNITNWWGV
jgi:hypothetical protein